MRGFASAQQTQRFLTLHGFTQNIFRLGHHAGGQLPAVAHTVVPGVEGIGVCICGMRESVPLFLQ